MRPSPLFAEVSGYDEAGLEAEDNGANDLHFDAYYCELQADINSAEVEGEISSEQAWYLRETYLRIQRGVI